MSKLLSTTALMMALVLAGAAYAEDTHPPAGMHTRGGDRMQQRKEAMAQLPPEKAKLFQDSMKQVHEKNEALQAQARKLHEELDALLTAEKFDKDAWTAKSAEIDKVYDQMRANRNAAFVAAASQFSADERKTLSKMNRRPMMHGGGKPPSPAAR